MQQRARAAHDHAVLSDRRADLAQRRQRGLEVVDPDVAAVDDARDDVLVPGQAVLLQQPEVAPPAHQVEADRRHRQAGERAVRLVDVAEVGLDEQLRGTGRLGQPLVGARQGRQLGRRAVLHEHRLVELHPARAGVAQQREHLGVDLQQLGQQRQPVEAVVVAAVVVEALREQQERERADQHRHRLDARRARLEVLLERLARAQPEARGRRQLRHEVVVVGVEPLRHLERRDVEPAGLRAARHREVRLEADRPVRPLAACIPGTIRARPIPRRHRPDHRDRVEHVVVVRERVRRHEVDPRSPHPLPRLEPQPPRHALEVLARHLPIPEPLDGLLQLTPRTDARVAGDGGQGHAGLLGTCDACGGDRSRRGAGRP